MRTRIEIAALLIALSACGGGSGPAVPAGDGAGTGPIEVLEQAQDVADQLDSREAEMEQLVEDLGGG